MDTVLKVVKQTAKEGLNPTQASGATSGATGCSDSIKAMAEKAS